MFERERKYLLSLGYSEAEVEETLANATEEDLRDLVPGVPEARAKPKAKPKTKPKGFEPKPIRPVTPEFDPVKAAMTVIDGGTENKVVKYTVTPVFKLTLCTDVDNETFNAIKAELKSLGGKWSDEIEGFWFDTDPSMLF